MTDRLTRFFERATRPDGEPFYRLTEDCPDWLYEAVHAAHDGELPNDWRFEACRDILGCIDDGSAEPAEIAESLTDVYTGDLLAWLAGNLERTAYGDEALVNNAYIALVDVLQAAQCECIYRMASILVEAVDENLEEEEDEEEEDD